MAPTDSSSVGFSSGNFELICSLKAANSIQVNKYKSSKTGLKVVFGDVEGPAVNGYFVLATESFCDDGLPHTLEHLIFLGSEDYPYKGVLDLLANRSLASGTNAWTDTDHTCYTIKTAGSEGFLSLLPIYLDHILYPMLTDSAYLTEVYHVTKEGKDAGVVYCEEQGYTFTAESIVQSALLKAAYPGKCGYNSNTGGLPKNLRESTNNEKVKDFHKKFYRPDNLTLIITGQIKAEDVFKSLEAFEEKVLSKGPLEPYIRPWQDPILPLLESVDKEVLYPSDKEDNGLIYVGWRGPSTVHELYKFRALIVLLKYLTDTSVSPLTKAFVEIEDPYASEVSYTPIENSESLVVLEFEGVPLDKLTLIKDKLKSALSDIANDVEPINMERLFTVIHRKRLDYLSSFESVPHKAVTFMIIGDMLYGNTKEDLDQRLNEIDELNRLEKEEIGFWKDLMKSYLVDAPSVMIRGRPSKEEQKRLEDEDEARVAERVKTLGDDGLAAKDKALMDAIDENERPPPDSMLVSVPVPSVDSIKYHTIKSYRSNSSEQHPKFDTREAPVFMHVDHVHSNFVYMFAMLDSSKLDKEQRLYLPLLFDLLVESPVSRDGVIVPYEEVITQLEKDTACVGTHFGFQASSRFECGPYCQTSFLELQVELEKYERGIVWLRELLYQIVLTEERIRIVATKLINDVSQVKRHGNKIVKELMKGLIYNDSSNHYAVSMLRQNTFLTNLVQKMNSPGGFESVHKEMTSILTMLTDPNSLVIHVACDLDKLSAKFSDPISSWKHLLPEGIKSAKNRLKVISEWELMKPQADDDSSCVVGVGAVKLSYYCQTIPAIKDFTDPDLAPLLVFLQYLTQLEGPMWRKVRGQGLAYSYSMIPRPNEGLLYLTFYSAIDVVRSYKEVSIILKEVLGADVKWDQALFESAKSSLIFEIIERENTVADIILQSQLSYFKNVGVDYNRNLVNQISKVTLDQLNVIGQKYIAAMLAPDKAKITIVTDPAKLKDINESFTGFGKPLKIYETLETSFLNN